MYKSPEFWQLLQHTIITDKLEKFSQTDSFVSSIFATLRDIWNNGAKYGHHGVPILYIENDCDA